jgi:predicted CXXCH cytochrome family protein
VEARQAGVEDAAAMAHPRRLPAPVSAQLCGQCHSVNTPYTQQGWADWLLDGPSYRAGEKLADSRFVVRQDTAKSSPLVRQWLDENPGRLEEWIWPDGMVRVSGREYNGLLDSPCFAGGEMSCVSCHSQHNAEPDDLLPVGMRENTACLGCHEQFAADVSNHTHHAAGSEGSRCYNCHMPHTSYGLLKAIRSHTIDSPSVRSTVDAGRPNACNLCHLDRTLEWTAVRLKEWYGQAVPKLSGEQKSIAYAPLTILKGDAGQRALMAWHMGWQPAQQASGRDWLAPFLAETLTDPYDVVRYIGGRSLGTLPEFESFRYDFIGTASARAEARERALGIWRARVPAGADPRGEAILRMPGGVDRARIEALLRERDDRPMTLGE